jgi:hypothetical protein
MSNDQPESEFECYSCGVVSQGNHNSCPICGGHGMIRMTLHETLDLDDGGYSISSHWVFNKWIIAASLILMLISACVGFFTTQIIAYYIALLLGFVSIVIGLFSAYQDRYRQDF